MRIILDPIGSEGDARPLAALGGALKKAGHEPLLAISPGLEYLAEQVGISYVMSGLNVKELMAANPQVSAGKSISTMKTFFRLVNELVKGQIDFLCKIAKPSDCIILSGAIPIGGTVAEKIGCKSFHAAHWPGMFPSPAYPPNNIPYQKLPPFANQIIWGLSFGMVDLLFMPWFNRIRISMGLNKLSNTQAMLEQNFIIAMDPLLCPLPERRNTNIIQTGYWPMESDEKLDPALLEFIHKGEKPIYIGFGSMAHKDYRYTSEIIRNVVESLGIRAIVAGGWAGQIQEHHDNIFFVTRAPHNTLFPLLGAAIHHGGAGTFWTCAKAGITQAAIPHMFDQYYWCERIAQLGIGPRGFPINKLTVSRLRTLLQSLINNTMYRERTLQIAQGMQGRSGIDEAVVHIEKVTCFR
jgi:vancomycin aglycone glucosyltransferase